MALNFPNSPTNGQLYTDTLSGNSWTYDSANTCWKSTSTYIQTITVSSSAPGTPAVGQLWWNRDYGRLLVYYSDGDTSQWVDASPSDYTSQLAYNQANAAFGKANNALAITSGTFAGNLVITNTVGIGTAPASGFNLHVQGKTKIGVDVAQGNPNSSDISANAHTMMGGYGGNYLSIGQYANATQWIQSSYANPSTATYNMVLQPLGGFVTKPTHPMCDVQLNGQTTSAGPFNTSSVYQNNGGYWSNSTHRFTCPIAGYYLVTASAYTQYSSSYGWYGIYINGNNIQTMHFNHNGTTLHTMMGYSRIVYCAASDYIQFGRPNSAGSTYFDVTNLTVMLIG